MGAQPVRDLPGRRGETDVVHLATDDTLVPLPMDVALAEPA